MASGGRHGLAQSLFQVGGNTGSAIGPLVAAFIVLPRGQSSVAWFSVAALLAIAVLWRVGRWYQHHRARVAAIRADAGQGHPTLTPAQVRLALAVLIVLIFSKYVYLTSISSYYTFYLIHQLPAEPVAHRAADDGAGGHRGEEGEQVELGAPDAHAEVVDQIERVVARDAREVDVLGKDQHDQHGEREPHLARASSVG